VFEYLNVAVSEVEGLAVEVDPIFYGVGGFSRFAKSEGGRSLLQAHHTLPH